MKSLMIILAGLYGSWHFTDLSSASALYRVFAPFCVFVFLVALLIWLISRGFGGNTHGGDGDGGFWGGDGDGGGDGGGD